MKVLRANEGRAHSVRLDRDAREQLKHLRLFIATKMDIQVSDSVLVRRAISLLTTEYDRLIRSTWIKGKEQLLTEEEQLLRSAAKGSTWNRKLRPVNILDKFPTYRQRCDERTRHFRDNWLEELDMKDRKFHAQKHYN